MKRWYVLIGTVLLVPTCGFGQWQQKATNPSWWPYIDAVTVPTIGSLNAAYAGEPLGMTQGWWPRLNGCAVFTNGKYYVIQGDGPATYTEGANAWADNRQSGTDIYSPTSNTWSSSRWDGTTLTGPRGLTTNQDLPGFPPIAGAPPAVYNFSTANLDQGTVNPPSGSTGSAGPFLDHRARLWGARFTAFRLSMAKPSAARSAEFGLSNSA